MPDLWIDDHLGDEARPRPEFKAALRSSLAADLGRRRAPWRAIGWVAAAVALVGVVVTVVLGTRDDTNTISPSPSGQALVERVQGITWYVATDDEIPVPSRDGPASFELRADGSYVGSDGCNDFGSTIDSQPESGWSIDGTTLRITGSADSTAVGCLFRTAMPLVDGSELSLSADATTLTITDPGGRTYVATSLPPLTGQALADRLVGVRWTVTSVQNESSPKVAWFELSDDGTISGFNGGCLLYSGAGWSIDGDQLTVPPVTASPLSCVAGEFPDIIPLTGSMSRITIDGLGLGLTIRNEEAVYTAVPADDAGPLTTATSVPDAPALTAPARADLLAAALVDRARVHNSFGGAPLPVADVLVVDTVGEATADGSIDLTKGTALTPEERDAITAAFAPNEVDFVSSTAIPYPRNDGDRPVLQVGTPLLVDGQFAVLSSLTCGSSCATGGAITALQQPDGTWTMGDPIGPQFVA